MKIPPTADEREPQECGEGAPAREMPPASANSSASHSKTSKHLPQENHPRRSPGRKRISSSVESPDTPASSPPPKILPASRTPCSKADAPSFGPKPSPSSPVANPSPAGTSRALGWDTPSAPSQSGKYFGPASYGHLGYTGTSLWIDPDRQLSITLLTNRTWPDCSNQAIKQLRPRFHDAIMEALHLNR